jgi:hypothetical protein
MTPRRALPGSLVAFFVAGAGVLPASGCLDALGHDEDTTQTSGAESVSHLEDDSIADKHPTFDPSSMVTENISGCDVTLNKSATVTKLDIVPFEGAEAPALEGKLFRGRAEGFTAMRSIVGADLLPSMEVLNGALKPFNDGLFAAVELAVEDEKHSLLADIEARLAALIPTATTATRPAFEDAAVLVAAALAIGGDTSPPPAGLADRIAARIASFEDTPLYARPIGFYTWTPALEQVFARDRLLQDGDDLEPFDTFGALAYVLGQDADLLARYQHVTSLYAGLTDPYESYTVDALIPLVASADSLADPSALRSTFAAGHPPIGACGDPLVAFLPASHGKDKDFLCNPTAAGATLLDAFVQAIQSGAVDLAPGTNGGWYDYQLYALETLLVPERGDESQHLLLTAGYKKKLVETFKSILIQTHETHVKDLGVGKAVSAEIRPVDVYPLFMAEPFPTFYLRTARAYRFLRTFLAATMGPDFLATHTRVLEGGDTATATLADELATRFTLLYGLTLTSGDAVGLPHADGLLPDELAEIDVAAATAAAQAWNRAWQLDADVLRDPRVIVPVVSDGVTTTYWAIVGVKALDARAEFVAGHEPAVTPTFCWSGNFAPHRYTMLADETVELTLPVKRPPPTRDELRAVCDAHTTKDEIVKALQSP